MQEGIMKSIKPLKIAPFSDELLFYCQKNDYLQWISVFY